MDSFNTQSQKLLPGLLLAAGTYFVWRAGSRLYQSVTVARKAEEAQPWNRERVLREVCTASMGLAGLGASVYALRD